MEQQEQQQDEDRLRNAAIRGDSATITALLELGVNVEAKDNSMFGGVRIKAGSK